MDEIVALRIKTLTLHQFGKEEFRGELEKTKLNWKKELMRKRKRRKVYEEINNKINNQKILK